MLIAGVAGRPLSLTLLPCGAVEPNDLDYLAGVLGGKGFKLGVAEKKQVPAAAFNSARQQYRADFFLSMARQEPGDRVLAVTNYNLYDGNLNFVFGMADSPGRAAVMSLFRLRVGANQEIFRQRALKEAVHELGHTFGLSHCINPRCVMYFSNSLADSDRKGADWCEKCDRQL